MTKSEIIKLIEDREEHHKKKYKEWVEKHGALMNGFNIRADECKEILKLLK